MCALVEACSCCSRICPSLEAACLTVVIKNLIHVVDNGITHVYWVALNNIMLNEQMALVCVCGWKHPFLWELQQCVCVCVYVDGNVFLWELHWCVCRVCVQGRQTGGKGGLTTQHF